MPKRLPVFARWVQHDFLAYPSVQQLNFRVVSEKGGIKATSPKFAAGLSMYFKATEVMLSFEVNGETIDLLRSYEMFPKRHISGVYFCSDCLGERKVFRTLREMYFDHCLRPLIEDIESGLLFKPIRWEVFPSGSSYAEFF
jgi:hypothetical protein